MDPVSVGLLVALAGGAGGEIGRQAWAGLSALVRRPAPALPDGSATSTGEVELRALGDDPANTDHAHALSTTLAVRAAMDAGFRQGLREWADEASTAVEADPDVLNSVHGSTVHGHVIQAGRDVSGMPLPPPPPSSSAR
ncbi:hypothetical protein [Streptomyces sp. V3I7]|uniref:hypothetical protein n=1 Tax=Streptomyces sp. V3I7 TaxID=3042278 RepID=UPI00278B2C88|nr:hypothetical protein [Streptomyces sp. V3I7]MDQ0989085.1 hypothetical protein [Streptomyces sp. V3I7]